MEIFNLLDQAIAAGKMDKIKKFLKEETKELSASGSLHVKGNDMSHCCDIKKPHPPHIVGEYTTVNHGKLHKYCRGQAGEIITGYIGVGYKLVIHDEHSKGNAHYPSKLKSRWALRYNEQMARLKADE